MLNWTKNLFRPLFSAGTDGICLEKIRIGQAYSKFPSFDCPSLQEFTAQGFQNPGVVSLYVRK